MGEVTDRPEPAECLLRRGGVVGGMPPHLVDHAVHGRIRLYGYKVCMDPRHALRSWAGRPPDRAHPARAHLHHLGVLGRRGSSPWDPEVPPPTTGGTPPRPVDVDRCNWPADELLLHRALERAFGAACPAADCQLRFFLDAHHRAGYWLASALPQVRTALARCDPAGGRPVVTVLIAWQWLQRAAEGGRTEPRGHLTLWCLDPTARTQEFLDPNGPRTRFTRAMRRHTAVWFPDLRWDFSGTVQGRNDRSLQRALLHRRPTPNRWQRAGPAWRVCEFDGLCAAASLLVLLCVLRHRWYAPNAIAETLASAPTGPAPSPLSAAGPGPSSGATPPGARTSPCASAWAA